MDAATLEQLRKDTATGTPVQRIMAIEALADFAATTKTAPHDELIALCKERSFGDDCERDRDVREALYRATRRIAVARGGVRGLRVPAPALLDPKQVAWSAIELVWDAVTIYEGPEMLESGLALATEGQRGVYGMWWTDSEVRNGGFAQYFSNPTAIVAPFALAGMRRVGADEMAGVLERAIARFPAGAIADRATRLATLDRLEQDAFGDLDREFYARYSELFPRIAAYIRDHRDEFYEP